MVILSLILFFFNLSISWTCIPTARDRSWPVDYYTPFSYPTPTPINIISSQVKPSPLAVATVSFNALAPYLVTNTGSSLIVTSPYDIALVEGGFFKTSFIYESAEYIWGRSKNSSVGFTIDGVGGVVQSSILYRNAKYPTREEAIKRRDGFYRFNTLIHIGLTPNLLFEPFCEKLRGPLKKANSSALVPAGEVFLWLTIKTSPVFLELYMFPGSYLGKDCTIDVIVPTEMQPSISESQFEAFVELGNASPSVTPFPSGCRPITTGLVNIALPV